MIVITFVDLDFQIIPTGLHCRDPIGLVAGSLLLPTLLKVCGAWIYGVVIEQQRVRFFLFGRLPQPQILRKRHGGHIK